LLRLRESKSFLWGLGQSRNVSTVLRQLARAIHEERSSRPQGLVKAGGRLPHAAEEKPVSMASLFAAVGDAALRNPAQRYR
jgi:hypothetical protein